MISNTSQELKSELEEGKGKRKYNKREKAPIQTVNVMTADQYAQMIGPVIAFSGEYMATAARWEGFKFSQEEIQTLATQGGSVAQELAPMVATKEGKIVVFAFTACAIVGMKYLMYRQHLQSEVEKQNKSSEN